MKIIFSFISVLALFSFDLVAQGVGGGGGRTGFSAPPAVGFANNGLISSNTRYGSKMGRQEMTYEDALIEYQKMEGSPFLGNGEITVDLVYYTDSILKGIDILYDLYNEEMIVRKEDESTIILDPMYYRSFSFKTKSGKTETYKRVNTNDFLKFYHILFENEDFTFCSEWVVSVIKNTRHVPGQDIPESKFFKRKKYFIITDDKTYKVKLANGAAIENLPVEYQKKVPALMKRIKLKKLKNEKHYLTLMNAFKEEVDRP